MRQLGLGVASGCQGHDRGRRWGEGGNWRWENRGRSIGSSHRGDWRRNNRSRSIGAWHRPDWFVRNSGSLVPNISDEAGVLVADGVRHDLGSAIGQEDSVLANSRVAVPSLVVAEVGAAVVRVGLKFERLLLMKTISIDFSKT